MEQLQNNLSSVKEAISGTKQQLLELFDGLSTKAKLSAIATSVVGALAGANPAMAQQTPQPKNPQSGVDGTQVHHNGKPGSPTVMVTVVPSIAPPNPKAPVIDLRESKTPSVSANTAADQKGGQLVDTPFGKLSFVDIQKHAERTKILEEMKRGEKASFRDWEEQVAIRDADLAAEGKKAAIAKNDNDVRGIMIGIDKMIALGKKLGEEEKKALNSVIAYGKPPDMVLKARTILATL